MLRLACYWLELALGTFAIAWGWQLTAMWWDNPDHLPPSMQLAVTAGFFAYLGGWCLADILISQTLRKSYGNAFMGGVNELHPQDGHEQERS